MMKSKISIIYGVLLLFDFQNLICQSNSLQLNSKITNYEPSLTGELFTSVSNVELSTYFNSVWLSGDIYLTNGEVARNKQIKYNGLLDELLWLETKSKNIIKLDKEAIELFHFHNMNGDTSVYFRKIKIKHNVIADSIDVFAEEVYNGSLSLFILHTFIVERKELVETKGGVGEKIIYAQESVYVFKTGNNKTFATKTLNRNNLYRLYPTRKEQIKQYCKTNEIGKVPTKSDLVRLTQFLMQL